MNFAKTVFAAGIMALFFWVVLFSYHLVMVSWNWTPEQEKALSFVQGKNEQLAGDYTSAEQSHMSDVQRVMKSVGIIFIFLTILLGVLLYWNYIHKKLNKLFLWGGVVTVALMVILLLGMLFFFAHLFTGFHSIFFPQGNWQFASDSLLIRTFPLELFVSLGRMIFLLTLAGGSFFILLGIFLRYDYRKRA